ncbi:phenoloxidase-activating factor 2 [Bicyclus anynana]|uniref:Phenoloxidase-activating factor 2 n=1 Tax=Bicyclus anynana TaxID=110368 RepID=A0ABM3M3M6_BICAN|nr:phenoloxidase-activating factor 2 [Bicyclus anynana]
MRLLILIALIASCSAEIKGHTNRPKKSADDADDVIHYPGTHQQRQEPPSAVSCYTTDQEEGRCVKSSMCLDEAPKIDSTRAFVYRSGTNPCNHFQMCCPVNKLRPTPVVPTIPPTTGCGYSNAGGVVFRETTGTSTSGRADFAEFPWMVALLRTRKTPVFEPSLKFPRARQMKSNYLKDLRTRDNNDYIAGGTLVHPSAVLTVAHRVEKFRAIEIKCRAGEWNTLSENEWLPHQERDVYTVYRHPLYNMEESLYFYDVALVLLKKPFTFAAHVNLACVSHTLPPPGTVCYTMGWGKDFNDSRNNENVLKKIAVPLVSPADCERKLRNTVQGSNFTLHNTLTCAGGVAYEDDCVGDEGSPLVCPLGDPDGYIRYTVVGMVAYAPMDTCGADGVPGVYVNIPEPDNDVDNTLSYADLDTYPGQ